ncbi:hypothetical protein ACFRIC_40120 [Streptomyces sp. NPDC056738]|uniref:hypothetical protein n=1 Tax=Streptomyces sp. NPDC056738 TaxID=3345933 RepID=UPI00367BEABD
MWEKLFVTMILAIMAESLLRRIRRRWHRMRVRQTVAALSRGDTARIRCAARCRNSGGGRHRARLTVEAEGASLSTSDGTVEQLQFRTPLTSVEVVPERSMLVYNTGGRQFEILLPAGEDRLFDAVVARLLGRGSEHLTAGTVSSSLLGSAPAHHKS